MYAFEFEGLVVYAPGNKTPVAGATWRQLTVCCSLLFEVTLSCESGSGGAFS